MNLPDVGYMTYVIPLIKKIVNLELGSLSDKDIKEVAKEIKKNGFLAKLEYIKQSAVKDGKDISQLISEAKEYWKSIKGNYDNFEIADVERKLDEIILEEKLSRVRVSGKVNFLSTGNVNYFLVREKLQEILNNESIGEGTKLLVTSWLGESVGETGKIDVKAMKRIIRDKKVWEVLAGVKDVAIEASSDKRNDVKRTMLDRRAQKAQNPKKELIIPESKTQALVLLEESEARNQQIKDVSEKYEVSFEKIKAKLRRRERIFVTKHTVFGKVYYRVEDKIFSNYKNVVAVVFNNKLRDIKEIFRGAQDLEEVVLPEKLEQIGPLVFDGCNLENIDFPETLKTIGMYAFTGNRRIKQIQLPQTTFVEHSAFNVDVYIDRIGNLASELGDGNHQEDRSGLQEENLRLEEENLKLKARNIELIEKIKTFKGEIRGDEHSLETKGKAERLIEKVQDSKHAQGSLETMFASETDNCSLYERNVRLKEENQILRVESEALMDKIMRFKGEFKSNTHSKSKNKESVGKFEHYCDIDR